MGVELQTDQSFVASEGEDCGLFGDVAAAADSRTALQLKKYGRLTRPTSPTQRLQKPASCLVVLSIFYFKQKTTVPPGASRPAAGAANALAREALANNTAEGRTNETSASSRLSTFTSMRPAVLLQAPPRERGPRLASRSSWQRTR